MKILVVTEAYPSENRPHSGFFVQKLVRALSNRGHEILVVCPRGVNSNWGLKGRRDGDVIIAYPVVPTALRGASNEWLFNTECAIATKVCQRVARKHRFEPDVVYAHFAFGGGMIASRLSKAMRVKFALMLGESSLQTTLGRGDLKSRIVKSVIADADSVMCVSQHLTDLARSVAPDQNISRVPNGVDLLAFDRKDKNECRALFGIPASETVFGFVGSISERKGSRVLLKISERLRADFKLMLATGSTKSPIPALYSGFVENAELPKFLSACDFFIFPTKAEGMSNALLEAMACGLVIITSDTPFNREFLNEKNSILLDFDDIEHCVSVLREAISKPEQFAHLGAQAELDVKEYSLDRRVDRIDANLRLLGK